MIIDRFLATIEPINYTTIIGNIKAIVSSAIDDIILDKPIFSSEDFSVYEYDDYLMGTNVTPQNFYKIYVRMDQDKNIKPITQHTLITQTGEVKKVKHKVPELFMGLDKIKKDLLEKLRYYFDETTIFVEEKYAIRIQGKDILDDGNIQPYYILIIPCISFTNDQGERGIMYYDNSKLDVQIEYHEQALTNFIEKYRDTNGLFLRYTIFFKNVFNITEKQKRLPYEVFETLFYNVPNEFYVDMTKSSAFKIMHYLLHCDVSKLKGLDGIDNAFSSKYRSMSYLYAKKAIKVMSDNLKMLNF